MTNDSPRYIALKSGAFVSLALTVVYIIMVLVGGEKLSLAKCAILALIAFFTSYGSFLFIFDRILKRQIRKIYETIEQLDSSKLELENNSDLNEDVLGGVSEVVMNWAELKSKEIEDLKKLENYRREFLGNVSHELKTPIFNIQGYLLTLLDGALNDDKVRNRYLEKAAFNIDRLSHIVEDLESISMLESGALKIEPGTFNIQELIQEVFEQHELKAEERNIYLGFKDGSNKAFKVYADKERIRQVVSNLITNSIKYGKEDGRTLIGIYDMNDHIMVEVSDNGIGISEKDLPRLFERFFRVDKSRSRDAGGTGLGLAIVKHLIEAHNQSLQVRSKLGIGSTFSFSLQKAA